MLRKLPSPPASILDCSCCQSPSPEDVKRLESDEELLQSLVKLSPDAQRSMYAMLTVKEDRPLINKILGLNRDAHDFMPQPVKDAVESIRKMTL